MTTATAALVRGLLRLAFGVAILALVLSRVDFSSVQLTFGPRLFGGIAVAATLLLLGQTVAALRWKVIWGEGSPSWAYLSRLYLIGAFFSLFLPTSVGGDAVRAAAATQSSGNTGGVVASVLLDRLMGTVALAVYGLAGLILAPSFAARLVSAAQIPEPGRRLAVVLGVAVVLLAVAILVVRRSARIRSIIADGIAAVRSLWERPRALILALMLAFAVQGIYLLLWLVLALAVALPLAPSTLLVTVPIVTAATMLPITLNGVGVREGAWVLLLAPSGLADGQIVSFSLLYLPVNLVIGVIGGLLFMAYGTAPPDGQKPAST